MAGAGRPVSIVGRERYKRMSGTLHLDRHAIFLDSELNAEDRTNLVEAIDKVLNHLQPLMMARKPNE